METTLELNGILNYLLDKTGLTESALGRKIGVPRATINRLTTGRTSDPKISTLKAIAEYFNVTVDQLLGKQPVFIDTPRTSSSTDDAGYIPIIDWSNVNSWKKSLENITSDNHSHWISADPTIDNGKFALKIQGESMSPQFQENTILVIDPLRKPKNRDFVLVSLAKNDDVLFRQLLIDGSYRVLKSINPIFPTIQLEECDKIIGVLIQTRNNFE